MYREEAGKLVTAVDGTTNGPASTRSSVVTPSVTSTAASAPVTGTVVAGNASATVNWDAASGTGGATDSSYPVPLQPNGHDDEVGRRGRGQPCGHGGYGQPYSFEVPAVFGTVEGPRSARSSVVSPSATAAGS